MAQITVVGSLNMDLVLGVERLPRPGETVTGGNLALFPGGKGANQACAAARLGGRVVMLGQIGTDPFAAALRDSLASAGVDTSALGVSDRPTGCASIYVLPSGENSIVISPGANAALTSAYLVEQRSHVTAAGFVLAQLETPIDATIEAFRRARSNGSITILDPAPACPLPAELLGQTYWLTPNQTEASLLIGDGRQIVAERDAEAAAERLLGMGPAGVVLKLGAMGCYVAQGLAGQLVAGFPVQAVDTTAAGDTFNGAFAVALAEGRSAVDAARWANAAAAISVTRAGAQASIPSREEVESFLAAQPSALPRPTSQTSR
jgi:ribokinase